MIVFPNDFNESEMRKRDNNERVVAILLKARFGNLGFGRYLE